MKKFPDDRELAPLSYAVTRFVERFFAGISCSRRPTNPPVWRGRRPGCIVTARFKLDLIEVQWRLLRSLIR